MKKEVTFQIDFVLLQTGSQSTLTIVFRPQERRQKNLVQVFPHSNLNLLSSDEFVKNCVYAFSLDINYTMARIKLGHTWNMEANESFLFFHSRLSAKAECFNRT